MQLLRSALALAGLSVAYGIEPTPIQLDVYGGETRYANTHTSQEGGWVLRLKRRRSQSVAACGVRI